jgi:hypothetical protein
MTGCLGLEASSLRKSFGNTTPFITIGNLRGGHAKSVIAPRLSMARFDSNHFCRFFLAAVGALIGLSFVRFA